MIQNALRQISRIIKPRSYIMKNTQPTCGRDVCVCLQQLNTDKYEDYDFYKRCYDSWVYFNRELNN